MPAHPSSPFGHPLGRRTLLKGLLGVGAAAAAAPILTACGSSSSSSSAAAATGSAGAKLDKVTFQLGWKKLTQFGGHFAAIQQGYFAANGIEPNFLSGGPNIDPFSVVSGGQAMLGDGNGSDVLLANSKGIPLTAIATIYQQTPNALMSLKSNPVTTLKEMEGKKVGLPTGTQPLLKAMLTKAGVDPKTVTMVPVGTDPSILTSKQVDGYIGYGTQQGLSLQQSGADVNIIYFTDLGNPDYGNAIFATADDVAGKKDVLTRFLKADIAGWKYFTEHPEEVAQYTWDQYHKETGAVLADEKVSGKAAVPLITAGDAKEHGLMWIEEAKFQTVYDLYKLSGTITKPVDISKIMTQDILIAAGDKA